MYSQTPKISIIMPVYNVEAFITQALSSCINQTFKDIEIIIIDDCGQDKSIEIAKEFALKDKRIKITYNEKNLGTLQSRLEGVKLAKGKYILNLDPDDFLDTKACEFAYRASQNGLVDIVSFGAFFELHGEENKIFFQFKNACFSKAQLHKHFLQNFFFRWNVWAKLIKTEKYKQVLPYLDGLDRIGGTEDALQFFILYSLCENFVNIDTILYFYRINPQSSMNDKKSENILKIIQSHKIAIQKIKHLKKTYPKDFGPILYKMLLYFLKNEQFIHSNRLKKQEGKFNFYVIKSKTKTTQEYLK